MVLKEKNQGRQTARKLEEFAMILPAHIAACSARGYTYIDTFAGPGEWFNCPAVKIDPRGKIRAGETKLVNCAGSPILADLALKEALIKYEGHLFEVDPEHVILLKKNLLGYNTNTPFEVHEVSSDEGPELLKSKVNYDSGLMYFDPTQLIRPNMVLNYMETFPNYDVLCRVQAKGSLRRQKDDSNNNQVKPITECKLGKEYYWFISQPLDIYMWCWVFGSKDFQRARRTAEITNELAEKRLLYSAKAGEGYKYYMRITRTQFQRELLGLEF
jgi:hypothetical protein